MKILKNVLLRYSAGPALGRSENPGVPVIYGLGIIYPLVEKGLTELSESGGAMAPPAPTGTKPPVNSQENLCESIWSHFGCTVNRDKNTIVDKSTCLEQHTRLGCYLSLAIKRISLIGF